VCSRSEIHTDAKLGLHSIVNNKPLKEKRTIARDSSTSNNVEDKVSPVKAQITNLPANCDNGGKVRQIINDLTIIAILTHKGSHHNFFIFCILSFKTTHITRKEY
jgi:hypothetical protein